LVVTVELSICQGVASIRFNRPEKLNSLTDRMWLQLRDHLALCRDDNAVRAVVLSGEGRGFSAGADIGGGERVIERKPGIAGIAQMMEFYGSIVRELYHLPKPTIAAVHGPAVGIAWTLALCCDWLLAAEDASFRPAFMGLAKVPEGGFQFLAARQIGDFKARDLIYRSTPLSGIEAARLGLAIRAVSSDALPGEAQALAAQAAALAPLSFKLTKQLFNARSGDFDGFLENELRAITIAASTSDAREGMAAFVEKRSASYSGT
jgi:2-(1,2-epoxy-1,2-dihydrophenyl)acetyl-CoA isomerase